jgi:hypothetical protein
LREIDAQRPFAEDHLPRCRCLRHEVVMVGHLHSDGDEVHAGVVDQLVRVAEGIDIPLHTGAAGGGSTEVVLR